jgi:hypothetical protein
MTEMMGGCLWGRVGYIATAEPLRSGLCHVPATVHHYRHDRLRPTIPRPPSPAEAAEAWQPVVPDD